MPKERTMKRNSPVVFLLMVLAFVWGCSQLSPTGPDAADEGTASIAASLSVKKELAAVADIDSIQIKVYGSSIDTINKKIAFAGPGTKVSLQVPAGKALVMEVMALRGATVVLHGSTSFKAEKNKTHSIIIKMNYMLASLILTPPDTTYAKDQNFDIYLSARNVTNLASLGAQVKFDTSAFTVVDMERLDTFLESKSGTVFPLKFSKDNTKGQVDIQLALFPASASVTGDGDICKITFKAKKTGISEIDLLLDNAANSNWGLFDNTATLISSLGLGSKVTIQ